MAKQTAELKRQRMDWQGRSKTHRDMAMDLLRADSIGKAETR